ncbi:putative chromatin regulator PHD family [Dioscorea sansibarensis]
MDQEEGEGNSGIPNPNPHQDGDVGGALDVVRSRLMDSPSLIDPVFVGEDGAQDSEPEEILGGDAAEKVEPLAGDALEDGKSLMDVWEEEMGPLVDVVRENEALPLDGLVEERESSAGVSAVVVSVPALNGGEETEPLVDASTETLEMGGIKPLEDTVEEERMEASVDKDALTKDETEKSVPLGGAVQDVDSQSLVNVEMEPSVDAMGKQDGSSMNGVLVEGFELLAGATEPVAVKETAGSSLDSVEEEVEDVVEEVAEEPLVESKSEEEAETVMDSMVEVAAEPLMNSVAKEAVEPFMDSVAEEAAEQPLMDSIAKEAAEPPLMDSIAKEAEEPPLTDSIAKEAAEPPLMDSVAGEAAQQPLMDSGGEGGAEPSSMDSVVEAAKTLMDSVGEGAVEPPLTDSVAVEVAGPLMDSVVEEAAELLMDSVEEVAEEPLMDSVEEEEAAKPLMDSVEEEEAAEPLMEPLMDSITEKTTGPLMSSRLEEAARTFEDSMVEEAAAPLEDSMLEAAAPSLGDFMVEDVEPFADTMIEEDAEPPLVSAKKGAGKRKRGRPPKTQSTRSLSRRKAEEDVCFICFDGGNLVVCDRRGCPKVYHPSCVNRDEAFFRSKGRWNCGWHICSICEKTASYMCYTCTYSLCKGCAKESAFVCIRGNKGLCPTCMSTVMLIETNQHANQTMSAVDFDDKTSWEFLFKDYWLDLKGKLSLTLEELNGAKIPRKESNVTGGNDESSEELYDANADQMGSSDSSSERRQVGNSSKKKLKKGSRNTAKNDAPTGGTFREEMAHLDDTDWASNELLEFVAHMKGGDKSLLSQFDVQALLLEYIKQNNLRDPRRKSQIICDARLQSLFGKPRVGHFEMLKLLESHFHMKEVAQPVTDDSQGGVVDPDSSPVDADGNSDASTRLSFDKRRKTRKRTDEKEPQTNLDDYAAIDVHNINLMYLKRNLMEDLIDDAEFSDKVIGCFVRIRISGASQKQDMYRLVQVVGTRTAGEKYKTGKKMTDIMLEILNLDKTEVVTIDVISNQDFTEEECKRLRQSIKCELIGRLTVGDVQEKARALQTVRVNDWLENEKSRLGHLRDRASEKGRRKEYPLTLMKKLQLLNTPEERMRRLNDVPEIHSDPHMDPGYESAEEEPDDKRRDPYLRSRESSSLRKAREAGYLGKGGSSSGTWNERKSSETSSEQAAGSRDRVESQRKDVSQLNVQSTPTNLETGVWNQLGKKLGQTPDIPSETIPASLPTGMVTQPVVNETEKIWHYKDPSGKIQGPFSMAQLRKWSTTGYFPEKLRIWKTSEKQDDAILLSDAMNGKFLKDPSPHEPQLSVFSQSGRVTSVTENRGNCAPLWSDNRQTGRNLITPNDASPLAAGNLETAKADKWASQPTIWSPSTREASVNTSALSRQVQGHDSPRSSASLSGNTSRSSSYQERGVHGGNAGEQMGHRNTWSSNRPTAEQKAQATFDTSKPWGNDPSSLPTPTPQAASMVWTGSQAALNSSVVSVQHLMNTGWGLSSLSSAPKETEVGRSLASLPISSLSDFQASHPQVSPLDVAGVSRSQLNSEPLPADNMSPVKNPLGFSGPSSREICGRNQFFESDCPSPTPKSEQTADDILNSEYSRQTALNGRQMIPQDGGRSDPASDSVYGLFSEGGNLPSRPDSLTESCANVVHTAPADARIKAETNALDSASSHRSEASTGSQVHPDMKSGEWSMPSPTPTTAPSGWGSGINSTTRSNNQIGLYATSDGSKMLTASQLTANASNETAQPSVKDVQNTGWAVPTPNLNANMGQAQGTGNVGAMIQGSLNPGWGMVPQNNVNMAWGIPAQGNSNMNVGWATPTQVNTNANLAWGPMAQGTMIANTGLGALTQGVTTMMPSQGYPNPQPGWGTPTPGNTNQNPSWGNTAQGNTNANASLGTNQTWDPSSGSSNWSMQQKQGGDGHSGQGDRGFQNNESGHGGGGGGRQSWSRSHSGGGGSRAPARGQRAGVCRFHENGHCKKGANCNYFHS